MDIRADVDPTEHPAALLEPLVSRGEAQRILGIGRSTMTRIIERGELRTVRIGARRLIDPASLRAFIDERRDSRNDDDPPGSGSTVSTSAGEASGHATA
jgi:excisionase family DNA binding protein